MVKIKEHNNRKKADQFAEYITGEELRRYVAEKVKKYVGDNPVVFDGAVGSGQLEQYVNPKFLHGVEVQEEACNVCKENYPSSEISHLSFFNYQSDIVADCVIMNPPFSVGFKSLSDEEKENIQSEFPWKKSGKVDDIFILKSLNHTSRYAFHICYPGVRYRGTEKIFREILHTKIVEMNCINNAFDDTTIPVLFLVIDKFKSDYKVYKETYDCKNKEIEAFCTIDDPEEVFEAPPVKEIEKEVVDIDDVNSQLDEIVLNKLKQHLETRYFIMTTFDANIDFWGYLDRIYKLLDDYKRRCLSGDI